MNPKCIKSTKHGEKVTFLGKKKNGIRKEYKKA